MRLFVGIAVPKAVADRLASAARRVIPIRSIESIRLTRPDYMHVTLSFLGSVEPGRLDEIQQSLARLHSASLQLQVSGIFINAGILFAKVEPSVGLLNLAEQVFLAMEGCGFPRERRSYLPHVTLARLKGRARSGPAPVGDPGFRQSFAASEFRLYESFTEPEGARYCVLRSFPLE